MANPTKINTLMYKLLIEKELNNFTVVGARNALLNASNEISDRNEARRMIYRQIWEFEKKGWLISKGQGRDKSYQQSEIFLNLDVAPASLAQPVKKRKNPVEVKPNRDLEILKSRMGEYEGELAIVLGEVEEYQALMEQFPAQNKTLQSLFIEAKERSANLLGKVNALSKLIQSNTNQGISC
jgi:hypothetical protein